MLSYELASNFMYVGLIKGMNMTEELDKLQKQRALGPPRHRKLVSEYLRNIKLGLAECLFCWACQTPLAREDTLHLLHHLQTSVELTADGRYEPVTVTLLMALLYSIDISLIEQEDTDGKIDSLINCFCQMECDPNVKNNCIW